MQMKRMAGSLVFLDFLCSPGNSRTSAYRRVNRLRLVLLVFFGACETSAEPITWNFDLHRQIHLLLARLLLDHINEFVHSHVLLTTVSSVRSSRSSARRWLEDVRLLCPRLDPACACNHPAAPNPCSRKSESCVLVRAILFLCIGQPWISRG